MKFIDEIAETFASRKRILILYLLQEPMCYKRLVQALEKRKVKAGTSEIYKHLKILLKHGYITKMRRHYACTLKGKRAIELLKEIVKTKPIPPKLKITFEG
ncbi:hypothetical protein J7L49_06690 [Candidatus Bathyarchaeota archaeon]|nr:hypothetical protein [Candidatus Bathyarchaeota archaeon]